MIVGKVQLSLWTAMDAEGKRIRSVLIYDEHKTTLCYEAPVSRFDGLEVAMGDRQRAFFECDLVEHLDPGCQRIHEVTVLHRRDCECSMEIIFGKMLPDQGW